MKQGMLLLLLLVGLPVAAQESKVYLSATFTLGGSNIAQSVFLHEPDITTLDACNEASRQGQRDRDWLKYHHILRRDKMKGFTGQVHYRCVTSVQNLDMWTDGPRYRNAYLIDIDGAAQMTLRETASLAACTSQLNALSADKQAQSHCAMSNQRILR
ncbi:hypothetical protein [Pseudomonas sp. PDM14]|uniref:hypothetical protein n=1 Tax=Pseudomonas sp. PDM14 TaxID=2769288 RepID=UPI001CE0F657|nr:hypothetical protein [Pseudomonas sp. PDM14]